MKFEILSTWKVEKLILITPALAVAFPENVVRISLSWIVWYAHIEINKPQQYEN